VICTFVVAAFLGVATAAIGAAPVALADPRYQNCTEAHADVAYDIPQNDPAYWEDGDRHGIACESYLAAQPCIMRVPGCASCHASIAVSHSSPPRAVSEAGKSPSSSLLMCS
jgi:hypothetical protein